jgi:predicted nucleic acid-binding protein
MRLFFDTNILIDLLVKREPSYSTVAKIFDAALRKKDTIVISNAVEFFSGFQTNK